ncbi:VapC toxin family PIN domain ribonuclease [Halobacteriales archaeon QS_3_64_16]|nr:MAG: VapC toxin family PIN domain ribonuclease [Halobacteriales archaeon QS_3_64_16]
MILDTTFVIDVMNDDEEAIELYREAEAAGQQQYLSSVTILELYEGVARAIDSAAERERVRDVIDTRPVRSADRTVMAKAGRISGELITEGMEIDREDCIIAATALIEERPVVTRNVSRFERIDGLDVRSY